MPERSSFKGRPAPSPPSGSATSKSVMWSARHSLPFACRSARGAPCFTYWASIRWKSSSRCGLLSFPTMVSAFRRPFVSRMWRSSCMRTSCASGTRPSALSPAPVFLRACRSAGTRSCTSALYARASSSSTFSCSGENPFSRSDSSFFSTRARNAPSSSAGVEKRCCSGRGSIAFNYTAVSMQIFSPISQGVDCVLLKAVLPSSWRVQSSFTHPHGRHEHGQEIRVAQFLRAHQSAQWPQRPRWQEGRHLSPIHLGAVQYKRSSHTTRTPFLFYVKEKLNFRDNFRAFFGEENRVLKMRGERTVFCFVGVAVFVQFYIRRPEGDDGVKRKHHALCEFLPAPFRAKIGDKRPLVKLLAHTVPPKLIDHFKPGVLYQGLHRVPDVSQVAPRARRGYPCRKRLLRHSDETGGIW